MLPPPVTLNHTRGFLSSPFPISSACGPTAPSWILLAKKGQNFKISLLDFSPEQEIKVFICLIRFAGHVYDPRGRLYDPACAFRLKGAGTNQQPEISTNCQSYGRIVELEEDHTGRGG